VKLQVDVEKTAMNMKSPDELEEQDLKKEYAKLTGKYELLSEQIEGELNEDNKDTLRAKKETTKRRIDEIWRRLEELERRSSDRSYQYLAFKEDLPKIDFNEVMNEVCSLIECLRRDRGDLLLVLQESLSMSGDLCLQRIREEFKRGTGDFKPYDLEFYSGDDLNEYGWLEQLGKYVGLDSSSEPEELAKLVIKKLCQSVKSGSTILLEIRKWDDLPCQEETLAWFMEFFWIPLVRCLDDRTKYPRVKFIATIVVDAELSSACFEAKCLCEEKLPFRWMNLPLRNWTQEEIQEWLECYPGIGNPLSINLSQRFFRASKKGIPSLVCQALERELMLTQS